MADLDMVSVESQLYDTFKHFAPHLFNPNDDGRPGGPKKHKGAQLTAESEQTQDKVLQMLQLVCRLTIQHDRALETSRRLDTYILFLGQSKQAVLPKLLETMKVWHQQQKDHTTTGPLRQQLMLTMVMELQAKIEHVNSMNEQDGNWQALVDRHIILTDKRWPFLRWNHSTQKLEPAPTTPLTLANIRGRVQALLEGLQNTESVVRFQALKPLTDNSTVIPWRLQLHPRMEELHQALMQLISVSAWQLLQVSVKRHQHQESPLATQLNQLLHPTKGKGKGGKGKDRTRPSP